MERLHPDTIQTLRQLIKLHGTERLLAAILLIEKEADPPPWRYPNGAMPLDDLIGKNLTEKDL